MKKLTLGLLVALLGASAAHGQTIEWKVADRFRLWDQARVGPHVVSLEQLLDKVALAGDAKAVEIAMLQFLATQSDLHHKAYWRSDLEIYDREYVWPINYRVQVWARDIQGLCRWNAETGTLSRVEAPCSEPVDLTIKALDNGSGSEAVTVTVQNGAVDKAITVQVADRLIASIGDSFAAGEGNPDIPMDARRLPRQFAAADTDAVKDVGSTWTAFRFVKWKSDWTDRWLGRSPVVGFAGGAEWWDPRCHRSFYSQHMVAALRYAAARPHEATTFITYACSGAKTFEGLLVRQSEPPGYRDRRRYKRLKYAQAEVMVANLCAPRAGASARANRRRTWESLGKQVSEQTWRCETGVKSRSVDALMVTDGGNDIGFGPVIQDAMLPSASEVSDAGKGPLKQLRALVEARSPERAYTDIRDYLPKHYDQLRTRLGEILPANTPVLQSVYPNPLHNADGALCEGDVAARRLAAMNGFWPDRNVEPQDRWRMHISLQEAKAANDKVVAPLNAAIGEHIRKGASSGWRMVDEFSETFNRRGWCGSAAGEPPGALPNWSPELGQWVVENYENAPKVAWSPTEWSPYASRTRLFRTPNDAALTQQPQAPRRFLGVLAPLADSLVAEQQESLLASMSGSFHPTFEAHAIMGWSVGEDLLRALPPKP